MQDVAGSVAFITGAASGIGKEAALAFARRGADLVICDVNEGGLAETEGQIRALGRDVLSRRVDVADRNNMAAFANAVHNDHRIGTLAWARREPRDASSDHRNVSTAELRS